jgi:hypothetical protein
MDALMGIHGDLDEAIALPMEVRQGGVDRSASLLTGLLASQCSELCCPAGEKATGKQLTEPQEQQLWAVWVELVGN